MAVTPKQLIKYELNHLNKAKSLQFNHILTIWFMHGATEAETN